MHDSHAHIISDNPTRYPVVNPDDPRIATLLRDAFTAERLMEQMDDSGVSKALIVQRSQVYGFDNLYIIEAAAASNGRLKAVCNINAREDGCRQDVAQLHASGAVGFRLMADIDDKSFEWLDGPAATAFWIKASELATPVCVHFFRWNREEGLARLDTLLDHHPVAHVVIDHLTNSPIESVDKCGIDDWVRRMADRKNVSLKFTAIPLNELAERDIDVNDVLNAYLAIFGPDRLLWGSDVTQSKGAYAELVAKGAGAVTTLPPDVQTCLLESNVARIYNL